VGRISSDEHFIFDYFSYYRLKRFRNLHGSDAGI
jgi:hypothetical protein